jgi:hypothetical protein
MDEKSQKVLPNFPPKGIENLRSGWNYVYCLIASCWGILPT